MTERARGLPLAFRSVILMTVLLAGCTSGEGPTPDEFVSSPRSRNVAGTRWDVLFSAGGLADSVLQSPSGLAVTSHGAYVIDWYAKRIHHFDPFGERLWSFGSPGAGPGEFVAPRVIKADAAGRAWVMDSQNLRLTVLDSSGASVFQVPLLNLADPPYDFIPLAGDRALVVAVDPEHPFVVVRRDGTIERRFSFPWAGFQNLSFIASQFIIAANPREDAWVASFVSGNGFFIFENLDSIPGRNSYVEHVPFPEIREFGNGTRRKRGPVQKPVFAARALSVSPERIYVLFGGRTPSRERIVDSYDLDSGAYVESFELPSAVSELQWWSGSFYVLHNDPYPRLARWRPSDRDLP